MLRDDPQLKPQHRMPRVFGALPGPRNVPADKRHLPNRQRNTILSVSFLTDERLLSELLPESCTLFGAPVVTVSLNFMANIGWLAGRGYGFLGVSFPIEHRRSDGLRVPGNFIPVCWENLADPILTGREELGFAKLYADMPPLVAVGNSYAATASWLGFGFFEMEVSDAVEATLPPSAGQIGNFHHKYIPRTGALDQAEVDQLVYAGPGESVAGYDPLGVDRRLTGSGRIAFRSARWEDMPFQYPIVNALAALPIESIQAASVTFLSAQGTIGNPSAGALKPVGINGMINTDERNCG